MLECIRTQARSKGPRFGHTKPKAPGTCEPFSRKMHGRTCTQDAERERERERDFNSPSAYKLLRERDLFESSAELGLRSFSAVDLAVIAKPVFGTLWKTWPSQGSTSPSLLASLRQAVFAKDVGVESHRLCTASYSLCVRGRDRSSFGLASVEAWTQSQTVGSLLILGCVQMSVNGRGRAEPTCRRRMDGAGRKVPSPLSGLFFFLPTP